MKIFNKILHTPRFNKTEINKLPEIKPDTVTLSNKAEAKNTSKIKRMYQYVISKKIHLEKNTVQRWEKLPLEEFLVETRTVISKKVGIPDDLLSQMTPVEVGKAVAVYGFDTNIIQMNPKYINKLSRSKLFMVLRHEIEHQKQSFDIFRTEGLGETAVNQYAKSKSKFIINKFKEVWENVPEEKVDELKSELKDGYQIVKGYKTAINQGKSKDFLEQLEKNEYDIQFSALEEFRQKVIGRMGIIPASSKQAKINKQYFDDMLNTQNNRTSIKTVFKASHENEATLAGFIGYYEYLFAKFKF